jgi:hypothetical protein
MYYFFTINKKKFKQQEIEDTKGVIRSRKSKKNRKYNGQQKKTKGLRLISQSVFGYLFQFEQYFSYVMVVSFCFLWRKQKYQEKASDLRQFSAKFYHDRSQ